MGYPENLSDLAQASASSLSMRNKLINPFFNIWQRGGTFNSPAANTYTADRWMHTYDGTAGTFTIQPLAWTPGAGPIGEVPEQLQYLRWDQTVAGSGDTYRILSQKIESVRTLNNRKATVSLTCQASANINVGIGLQQNFGSGGSAAVNTAIQTIAVTPSWQRFKLTFDVPGISGKTVGANDNLQLLIKLPINAVFRFDILACQVEAGPVATPYEERPVGFEFAMCERYYEVGSAVWGGVCTTTGQDQVQCHKFKVRKRNSEASVAILGASVFSGCSDQGRAYGGSTMDSFNQTVRSAVSADQISYAYLFSVTNEL